MAVCNVANGSIHAEGESLDSMRRDPEIFHSHLHASQDIITVHGRHLGSRPVATSARRRLWRVCRSDAAGLPPPARGVASGEPAGTPVQGQVKGGMGGGDRKQSQGPRRAEAVLSRGEALITDLGLRGWRGAGAREASQRGHGVT